MKETTGEKITDMKDRTVGAMHDAKESVSTKLGEVKETIVEGAKSAGTAIVDLKDKVVGKLGDAKDWTAEKAANPEKTLAEVKETVAAGTHAAAEKLDDVKVWTAEKAKQVDEMFAKGQAFLQSLGERIDHLKEWTEEKAKAAAEGLGAAKGVVGQVGESLFDAQAWTEERATKAGVTIDQAKDVLAKTERVLANKADTLSIEMKSRSALIHDEIVKLEAQMKDLSAKHGHKPKGAAKQEARELRATIEEKREELSDVERELKGKCTDSAPKAGGAQTPSAKK